MRWMLISLCLLPLTAHAQFIPMPSQKPTPPADVKAFIDKTCRHLLRAKAADYHQQADANAAHYAPQQRLDLSEIIIPLNIPLSHYVERDIPLDESPLQLGTMRLTQQGTLLLNEEPVSNEDIATLCSGSQEAARGKSSVKFGTVPAMQGQGVPALQQP